MASGSQSEPTGNSTVSRRTLLAGAAVGGALLATRLAGTPALAQSQDPLTAALFSLVVDGLEVAAFSELENLVTDSGEAALSLSARSGARLQTPTERALPTVILKRGLVESLEIWTWHEIALTDSIAAAQKACSLIMYGTDGTPVARYHLEQAWPSKIEVGTLQAGSSEILYETVTIVAERIQRVAPQ